MNARKPVSRPLGVNGPAFYDLRPGDRVAACIHSQLTGATGTVVSRMKVKRDGWRVQWDGHGMTGRAPWANLVPMEVVTGERSA